MKAAVLDILKEEGFVKNYESVNEGKTLKVTLKYGSNKEKVITGIKRISKPGLRVYAGKEELPRVLGGLGIAVISTSQGVMSDKKLVNSAWAAKLSLTSGKSFWRCQYVPSR